MDRVFICGYASVFNEPYDIGEGVLESVAPGAFDLSGLIYATAEHDDARCFARTDDGTLELWSDRFGLGFSFEAPRSWGGLNLTRSIAAGHLRGVSVNFASRTVRHEVVAGLPVDRVVAASISEISLTGRPASAATAAWHTTEDPDCLPPHVAEARSRWVAGRQAAVSATNRAQARATARDDYRTPSALLARIDRVLAIAGRLPQGASIR